MFTIFLLLFLLVAIAVVFYISSSLVGFLLTGVPFVRTNRGDVAAMVAELPITKKDVFYELGSGDGTVVFLVEKLTGASAKGFELTWWTYLFGMLKKKLLKSKAQFFNKNFFKADWSEATVIYGYLYPPLMGRVEEKFKTDCKPGTWAVVRDFPFPNLPCHKKLFMPHGHELYLYKR